MPKPKKLTNILLALLAIYIVAGVIILKNQYVVPIIMYHYFEPKAASDDMLNVSPETFDKQMRFLKEHKYNVITLEEVGKLISQKKKIPPKTIAITMDDGYKDNYTYAFPVLKKYNLPATIFLIYNEIDRPQNDRLNWPEIKEMQDSGLVTFGSHTLSHPWLTELKSEEDLKNEIYGSKKILEDRLGRKINTFSYPGGFFTDKIKKMVEDAGYKLAVATLPVGKFPNDDVFALKRLRISSNADNLFIFRVEASGYYTAMREFQRRRHKNH